MLTVADSLDRFVTGLRSRCPEHVRNVLLFGSRARGDACAGSDVDVLVVLDRRTPELVERVYDAVLDVTLSGGHVLSVKVCDEQHVQRMSTRRDPFLRAVRREGRDLWTRTSHAA